MYTKDCKGTLLFSGIILLNRFTWSFTVVEHVFRNNKFFMGIKKYSASMKSLVTFMNSLSCILKSESTVSSNTIYSISQGNSGKVNWNNLQTRVFIFSSKFCPWMWRSQGLFTLFVVRPLLALACPTLNITTYYWVLTDHCLR